MKVVLSDFHQLRLALLTSATLLVSIDAFEVMFCMIMPKRAEHVNRAYL